MAQMEEPKEPLQIAVVGKYVELPDSYISVREALRHAGLYHGRDIEVSWVSSEDIEGGGPAPLPQFRVRHCSSGGFGPRGVEGMLQTARYARERRSLIWVCAWGCRLWW